MDWKRVDAPRFEANSQGHGASIVIAWRGKACAVLCPNCSGAGPSTSACHGRGIPLSLDPSVKRFPTELPTRAHKAYNTRRLLIRVVIHSYPSAPLLARSYYRAELRP